MLDRRKTWRVRVGGKKEKKIRKPKGGIEGDKE
jgi:hypothetical protein